MTGKDTQKKVARPCATSRDKSSTQSSVFVFTRYSSLCNITWQIQYAKFRICFHQTLSHFPTPFHGFRGVCCIHIHTDMLFILLFHPWDGNIIRNRPLRENSFMEDQNGVPEKTWWPASRMAIVTFTENAASITWWADTTSNHLAAGVTLTGRGNIRGGSTSGVTHRENKPKVLSSLNHKEPFFKGCEGNRNMLGNGYTPKHTQLLLNPNHRRRSFRTLGTFWGNVISNHNK